MTGSGQTSCYNLSPPASAFPSPYTIDASTQTWQSYLVDLAQGGTWASMGPQGCAFFASDPSTRCGAYRWSDGRTPSEMCCACGGGTTSTPSPPAPPIAPPSPPPPCMDKPLPTDLNCFLLNTTTGSWSNGGCQDSCDFFSAGLPSEDRCGQYKWLQADPTEYCCQCGGGTLAPP